MGRQLGAAFEAGPDRRPLDKKVVEIVKQVGALYKSAKSVHAEVTLVTTREEEKEKKEVAVTAALDSERPNRFALRSRADKMRTRAWKSFVTGRYFTYTVGG